DLGIAILVVMWGAQFVLRGQFSWKKCPVALCLAALLWFAGWQLVPLPAGLLARISPATADLYAQLLPAHPEEVLNDPTANAPHLVAGSALSVYPEKTRTEMIHLLALLLTFALVRNNL